RSGGGGRRLRRIPPHHLPHPRRSRRLQRRDHRRPQLTSEEDPMTQPQNPAEDPELDLLAETSEDEYSRSAGEEPGAVSIDDALETDRVVAEGPDSRNADGYGFDEDLDRGGD